MLVHGIDNNDNVIPLLLDSSGNVIISASQLTTTGGKIKVDSSGRITVVADEPSYLNPVGSLGYLLDQNLASGTNDKVIFTVPANQRYILTGITVMYAGTVGGVQVFPKVQSGGTVMYIDQIITPVSSYKYFYNLNIVLEASMTVGCLIFGATLNDDFEGACSLSRIK